jgi:hypothetical protein
MADITIRDILVAVNKYATFWGLQAERLCELRLLLSHAGSYFDPALKYESIAVMNVTPLHVWIFTQLTLLEICMHQAQVRGKGGGASRMNALGDDVARSYFQRPVLICSIEGTISVQGRDCDVHLPFHRKIQMRWSRLPHCVGMHIIATGKLL